MPQQRPRRSDLAAACAGLLAGALAVAAVRPLLLAIATLAAWCGA